VLGSNPALGLSAPQPPSQNCADDHDIQNSELHLVSHLPLAGHVILPSKTDEARREIYERARTAVQESLRTNDPPLLPAELATEQFALEAAISRVETELPRSAREEVDLSAASLSFTSRPKEFVRSVWEKLDHNVLIIRNRLRLSETTKVVPTKPEITAPLAQDLVVVQRTQLKAKNNGRTTVLMRSRGGGLFMWWWRKVRKANIPAELHATFEQFGETVLATFLAMGATAKYTYTGPLGGLNESWQEALERHVRLWPQADDRSHASLRRCLDEWCEQQ
jgi:hypothetical protein